MHKPVRSKKVEVWFGGEKIAKITAAEAATLEANDINITCFDSESQEYMDDGQPDVSDLSVTAFLNTKKVWAVGGDAKDIFIRYPKQDVDAVDERVDQYKGYLKMKPKSFGLGNAVATTFTFKITEMPKEWAEVASGSTRDPDAPETYPWETP